MPDDADRCPAGSPNFDLQQVGPVAQVCDLRSSGRRPDLPLTAVKLIPWAVAITPAVHRCETELSASAVWHNAEP